MHKEKSNITVESKDTRTPSPSIADSLDKEKFKDCITKWHIAINTTREKNGKTEKTTNNPEDQENQYPLFY